MENKSYEDICKEFATEVVAKVKENETEVSERNQRISLTDSYVYGDALERYLDIPIGHDFTPVNWLRRTVEIHKNQFMGRGFQLISTYDTEDIDDDDQQEGGRKQVENDKRKKYAEMRKEVIESIVRDNGGNSLFSMLAESAGAAGDAAIKAWYDEKNSKYVLSPIESIENLYVIWASDDFRKRQAVAFVDQIPLADAVRMYNVPENTPTSPLGQPLIFESRVVDGQCFKSIGEHFNNYWCPELLLSLSNVTRWLHTGEQGLVGVKSYARVVK